MALDTNALYQMIQDNAAQAEGVKTAALNAPTFENQFGTTLREQDKTLSGAIGAYGDKVAELFAHDKYVADNWSKSNVPTNLQPEGFMEDPYARSQASANLYAQKGQEVGTALKTLETRKAVLGDLVQKALGIYEAAVKGKQADLNAKENEFANTLAVYKQVKDEEQKGKELALEYAKLKGSTIKTGNPEIDAMDDATVVAKAEAKYPGLIKGGTATERAAKARAALNGEYDDTMGLYRLSPTDKTGAGSLLNIYKQASAARDSLGAEKPNWLLGGLTADTGPWASALLGTGGPGGELRIKIDDLTADKINTRYGGALTESEIKRLQEWAPSSKDQEASNWNKLDRMAQVAKETFRNKLISSGYSQKDADAKVAELFSNVSGSSTTPTTNKRPPLNSFDK